LQRSKFFLAGFLFCCASARPALAQQAEAWTLETTLRYRGISSPVISPDGRRAAITITEPILNGDTSAWRTTLLVLATDAGAAAAPLYSIENASSPLWSPDGHWLAFASSRTGARNVWRVHATGGTPEAMTRLARPVGEFRWSPDSRWLGFVAVDSMTTDEQRARREKRDVEVVGESYRFARLFVTPAEATGGKRSLRLLTPQNYQVGGHVGAGLDGPGFSWAPDASAIVFTHSPSPLGDEWVNADVSIVELATGTIRPLIATKAAEGGVVWSPDGNWIAVPVTEIPASYALTMRIHLVSPKTGEIRPLAESYDRRPSILGWTADSKGIVISEVRSVVNRLSLLPADGGALRDISPDTLQMGGITIGARGTMVGFTSESPERAPEAFVSSLDDFRPRRISSVQPNGQPVAPHTEVVRWQSPDGVNVEGLLTYPIGWREGTRVPLLVIVHGGPPSAFTNGFTGRLATYPIALFAQKGYAVLRPNVRGSAGYGREFRYANVRDWGGGDFRDVMSGIDALAARGIADSTRVGLMGWSYGGYLTAISITRTTRFKAASVGAGITDLVSYSGTADIPGFVPSYYGGDFWDQPEPYRAGSAIANVKNVTTPTLIQHGSEDERVPIGQGYQLFYALKRRGIPVRMLVYPRQGHGISEPRLQIEAAQANLDWFDRWLSPTK
jgi:dipeptidyl aminopeptidase/acylaminoacyl peptidase